MWEYWTGGPDRPPGSAQRTLQLLCPRAGPGGFVPGLSGLRRLWRLDSIGNHHTMALVWEMNQVFACRGHRSGHRSTALSDPRRQEAQPPSCQLQLDPLSERRPITLPGSIIVRDRQVWDTRK